MERREALKIIGATVVLPVGVTGIARTTEMPAAGRLKQSVSRWPYAKIPLGEFCRAAKAMGLAGIDLLQPEDWPVVRDAGLVCSMGYPTKRQDFIPTGFNDPANHRMLLRELETTIPLAARAACLTSSPCSATGTAAAISKRLRRASTG